MNQKHSLRPRASTWFSTLLVKLTPATARRTSFPDQPGCPVGNRRLRVNRTLFGNGAWVSCSFQILSNAPLGGSTVAGEVQVVSDAASRKLPSTVVDGVVTVR
jgi:hypothetical protein